MAPNPPKERKYRGKLAFLTLTLPVLLLATAGCPEPDTLPGALGTNLPAHPSLEQKVFIAVNAERKKAGLRPLVLDGDLTDIARDHSRDMASTDRFSHRGADGKEVDGRLRKKWRGRTDRDWQLAGENVARNRGFDDPVAKAIEGWLRSKGHRKTMLTEAFRKTGIGVIRSRKTGYYYFTQVFLQPMPK